MPSNETCAQLFAALLAAPDLASFVTDPAGADGISAGLASLRARPTLELRSVAVNGERVDVVAVDGDDEWRVVFGTVDGARVDWLEVYERPAEFTGLDRGIAVVVNGPSSSGKSTLLRELQAQGALPWVVFDEPVLGVAPIGHLIWRDRASVLHRGFLDGIAALARAGNAVAVAAGGHPQALFDTAFSGVHTLRVGLDCEPHELARRESARRDVAGGLSTASMGVHEGWMYDLRFDTTHDATEEIAVAVLAAARSMLPAQIAPSCQRPVTILGGQALTRADGSGGLG